MSMFVFEGLFVVVVEFTVCFMKTDMELLF